MFQETLDCTKYLITNRSILRKEAYLVSSLSEGIIYTTEREREALGGKRSGSLWGHVIGHESR